MTEFTVRIRGLTSDKKTVYAFIVTKAKTRRQAVVQVSGIGERNICWDTVGWRDDVEAEGYEVL